MTPEFDTYAKSYEAIHNCNLAPVGADTQEFLNDKLSWCSRLAAKCFKPTKDTKTFLDYGCGVGRFGHEFYTYFNEPWNYIGVDLSSACIKEAQEHYMLGNSGSREANHKVAFHTFESWHDNPVKCDFILAACVFHHIEPNQRELVLQRLWKLLKPKGVILIWEHNPWNPITCKIVKECAFDRDACLLSVAEMNRLWRKAIGNSKTHCRFVTFFPGVLRRLKPMEYVLGWVPLGGQWVFWSKKVSEETD
jgi:SAM-dependent methyltransferase